MDKTDLMKEYEIKIDYRVNWESYPIGYTRYLESELLKAQLKAEAYDRLMSGGKKTLKEWANLTGLPFAINKFDTGCAFDAVPEFYDGDWHGFALLAVDMRFIDCTGDRKDSLTLPDGWED